MSQSYPERILFFEELTATALARMGAAWWVGAGPLREGSRVFGLYRVTAGARRVARLLRGVGIPIEVEEKEYDFFDDVEVPGAESALQECYFRSAPALLRQIETESWYAACVQASCRRPSHENYLHAALSKKLFWELFGRLRSVLVAQWIIAQEPGPPRQGLLFVRGDWLFGYLAEYAARWGLQLRPQSGRATAAGSLHRPFLEAARRLFGAAERLLSFRRRTPGMGSVRIVGEMYGNGIHPLGIHNTDLFWHRPGRMPAGTVIACFRHSQDQPSAGRARLLEGVGIEAVGRSRLLRTMYSARTASSTPRTTSGRALGTVEKQFLKALSPAAADFYREYDRWDRFFRTTRARIHVSTTDHFPESEALHAAMEDVGGVSVSIQRSIEHDARIFRRTAVDVHFAFAGQSALTERLSGSTVRQFIVSGYPFDAAFPAVREEGGWIRKRLRESGARQILCFLDENEGVVPRRLGGGRRFRNDYRFLCDRLEEEPTLGLILKPKRPGTLRERLGPIWGRVERALESGRCVLLEGQGVDERFLPSVAASAADLSINLLNGGTAGLESVLAGTRCLLLARGGEEAGIFRELPQGSVLFDSWERLWEAVRAFRDNPDHPAIGRWDPILDRLVLLRDGRSAERIAQYIEWLHEAFESGMDREQSLAAARRRYEKAWGAHLTSEIRQPLLELAG